VAWTETETGIVTVMKGTGPDTIAIATTAMIGREREREAKRKIRTETIMVVPLATTRIGMGRIPALCTDVPSHSDDRDPQASSILTATCP
jgi:hypothetical protein